MVRSELILKLADENPHLYQNDVIKMVDTIFEEITDALIRRNRVELRGFGIFTVRKRDSRLGRNPNTGEIFELEERHLPFFKVGKRLLDRLNEKSPPQKSDGLGILLTMGEGACTREPQGPVHLMYGYMA